MDNFVKQYCRLCLSAKSNEIFGKISDFTMGSLDILLLKLDLDQNKHLVCKVCALKVKEALTFKSMCLCTNNTIISHVDDETGSSVDLIEIYAEEKGRELTIYDLYGHKVCRLCMQLIKGKFMSVHEVEIEAIEKYIPEINFSIIKDPVVCQHCFDSIGTHSSFLKGCLEVEQKIKRFSNGQGSISPYEILPSLLCVKVEDSIVKEGETKNEKECRESEFAVETLNVKVGDIIIKQEDNEDTNEYMENKFNMKILERDEYEIKTECTDLKWEENSESEIIPRSCSTLKSSGPETQMHKCLHCDFETVSKSGLEDHIAAFHRNTPHDPEKNLKIPSKEKLYQCDKCGFKSTYKTSLKRHRFRCPSLLQMHGCDECHFKSRRKEDIKIHQMKHTNPSVEKMYQCDRCNYSSKYMKSLRLHQLIHKDPSQVRMYQCGKCDFKSKLRTSVKRHELRHTNPSSEETYPCDQCSYVGKCRLNLRDHQSIHKEPSRIYKCNECSYECRHRSSLRTHQFSRHSKQDGPTYKCDKCDYETKAKRNMKHHEVKHKNLSKEELYQCDKCSYVSKYKKGLKEHEITHKDPTEVQMYNCDKCSYETRHKSSLIRHQLIHKDVMFKCDECNFKTKHKEYVKKHRRIVHKDPSVQEVS